MRERITSNKYTSLEQAFDDYLPFAIAVTSPQYLQLSRHFELASAEYESSLASFLDFQSIGTDEACYVAIYRNLVNVIVHSTTVIAYQDQHDNSSRARLRPDISLFMNNALCVKMEFKASQEMLEVARQELVNKFHPSAYRVFPLENWTVVGLIGCPTLAELHFFSYNANTSSYVAGNPRRVYDMTSLRDRASLVIDAFKLCRWIVTIEGPVRNFHLQPDIRLKPRINIMSHGDAEG